MMDSCDKGERRRSNARRGSFFYLSTLTAGPPLLIEFGVVALRASAIADGLLGRHLRLPAVAIVFFGAAPGFFRILHGHDS